MGKKYIIELLDDCPSEFKGIIVFGLTPEGQISAEPIPVEDLPPYTEPDLEQVIKEAYQKGLSDAWDAAMKICLIESEGGLSSNTVCNIFNTEYYRDALRDYTPAEAIEKIRQYEEKEEIKVGDEVKSIESGWTAIVTKSEEGHLTLMGDSGAIANGYDAKYFVKTGRHFPEIAVVLQKMKER